MHPYENSSAEMNVNVDDVAESGSWAIRDYIYLGAAVVALTVGGAFMASHIGQQMPPSPISLPRIHPANEQVDTIRHAVQGAASIGRALVNKVIS